MKLYLKNREDEDDCLLVISIIFKDTEADIIRYGENNKFGSIHWPHGTEMTIKISDIERIE